MYAGSYSNSDSANAVRDDGDLRVDFHIQSTTLFEGSFKLSQQHCQNSPIHRHVPLEHAAAAEHLVEESEIVEA